MALASPSSWPTKWFHENEEKFTKRGWIVRFIGEPASVTDVSYFTVLCGDGSIVPFYEPITVKDIEPLEDR
jgi:hypothetical protein